ncbi:hypothetical protein IWX47DRAFT_844513 [Phyllosticta citricarpa]
MSSRPDGQPRRERSASCSSPAHHSHPPVEQNGRPPAPRLIPTGSRQPDRGYSDRVQQHNGCRENGHWEHHHSRSVPHLQQVTSSAAAGHGEPTRITPAELLQRSRQELRQWSRDNGQPHAGMIPNAAPGLSGPERRDNRVTSANTNGVAEFDGRNGHPHHPQHAGGSKNHHAPQPGRSTPVPIQHLVPRYGLRQSSESHVHPAMRSIPPSLEPVYGAFEETMAAAQPRPEHHVHPVHRTGPGPQGPPLPLAHRPPHPGTRPPSRAGPPPPQHERFSSEPILCAHPQQHGWGPQQQPHPGHGDPPRSSSRPPRAWPAHPGPRFPSQGPPTRRPQDSGPPPGPPPGPVHGPPRPGPACWRPEFVEPENRYPRPRGPPEPSHEGPFNGSRGGVPQQYSEPEPQPEPQPEPEQRFQGGGLQPVIESDPDPEPQPEHESEPEPEPGHEPEHAPEAEPEPEPQRSPSPPPSGSSSGSNTANEAARPESPNASARALLIRSRSLVVRAISAMGSSRRLLSREEQPKVCDGRATSLPPPSQHRAPSPDVAYLVEELQLPQTRAIPSWRPPQPMQSEPRPSSPDPPPDTDTQDRGRSHSRSPSPSPERRGAHRSYRERSPSPEPRCRSHHHHHRGRQRRRSHSVPARYYSASSCSLSSYSYSSSSGDDRRRRRRRDKKKKRRRRTRRSPSCDSSDLSTAYSSESDSGDDRKGRRGRRKGRGRKKKDAKKPGIAKKFMASVGRRLVQLDPTEANRRERLSPREEWVTADRILGNEDWREREREVEDCRRRRRGAQWVREEVDDARDQATVAEDREVSQCLRESRNESRETVPARPETPQEQEWTDRDASDPQALALRLEEAARQQFPKADIEVSHPAEACESTAWEGCEVDDEDYYNVPLDDPHPGQGQDRDYGQQPAISRHMSQVSGDIKSFFSRRTSQLAQHLRGDGSGSTETREHSKTRPERPRRYSGAVPQADECADEVETPSHKRCWTMSRRRHHQQPPPLRRIASVPERLYVEAHLGTWEIEGEREIQEAGKQCLNRLDSELIAEAKATGLPHSIFDTLSQSANKPKPPFEPRGMRTMEDLCRSNSPDVQVLGRDWLPDWMQRERRSSAEDSQRCGEEQSLGRKYEALRKSHSKKRYRVHVCLRRQGFQSRLAKTRAK